jgi:hypothetical protein
MGPQAAVGEKRKGKKENSEYMSKSMSTRMALLLHDASLQPRYEASQHTAVQARSTTQHGTTCNTKALLAGHAFYYCTFVS